MALLSGTATATERLAKLEERLADAVSRGVISQEEMNRVLARTKDRMAEVNQSARLLERGMDAIDSTPAGNMNSWQDWARVAVNEIQRVIAALARGQNLSASGGIFGAISGLFKLFSSSGASAQVAGSLAGGVALATPFAHGGSFTVGGSGGTDS